MERLNEIDREIEAVSVEIESLKKEVAAAKYGDQVHCLWKW